MTTMRAVRFSTFGSPSVLSLQDIAKPVPQPGEALVEVAASAINPSDVKFVSGLFNPTLPRTPGHTHPKSAFIYATVLEGAILSQVNDGPVTTYKAGQSFSELPGDRHGVSANASKTKPAKLLAVFVVDTNETELTIPFGN
jgi:quercetin dioxygenase-like cupin family protein